MKESLERRSSSHNIEGHEPQFDEGQSGDDNSEAAPGNLEARTKYRDLNQRLSSLRQSQSQLASELAGLSTQIGDIVEEMHLLEDAFSRKQLLG